MIEIRNISCGYPGREVLHGVSAVFGDGELTGIVGPNGCGKTTLFRAVCGEVKLKAGSILIDGDSAAELNRKERARRVARFHQERRIPDMTVRDLVEAGRHPWAPFAGKLGKDDIRASEAAMERCGVAEFAVRGLSELSGGERQRAYIAMLLAQDAKNLLLDEPAAFLDPAARFEMMDMFRALSREGMAVCVVMHDAALAMEYCDSVVVMDRGRVALQDAPGKAAKAAEAVFGIGFERTGSGAYAVVRR